MPQDRAVLRVHREEFALEFGVEQILVNDAAHGPGTT